MAQFSKISTITPTNPSGQILEIGTDEQNNYAGGQAAFDKDYKTYTAPVSDTSYYSRLNPKEDPLSISGADADKYQGGVSGLDRSGYSTTQPPSGSQSGSSASGSSISSSGSGSTLPTGATQQQIDDAKAGKYETKTPEQAAEDYRTSALKNQQDRINEIRGTYGSLLQSELAEQGKVNENSLGRTNALSAFMGFGGSSTADTRTKKTEQDNAELNNGITAKVNAQKLAALNEVFGRIDDGAQKVYEAQLETNKEKQKTLLDDVAKNAVSNLQSIAQTVGQQGKTFDDFKAMDGGKSVQSLIDQTGMSEYQLRQQWNNALPENLKPTIHTSYVDDGKGGTIMRQVTFNPVTKKAESQDYAMPGVPTSTFNGEKKIVNGKNGEMFVETGVGADGLPVYKDVSPNAANNKIIADAAAAKARAPKPAPTTAKESKALADMQKGIASVSKKMPDGTLVPWLGNDGHIAPDDYTLLRNAWIGEGFSATTFDTKMKGYRDPNNKNYVTDKQADAGGFTR